MIQFQFPGFRGVDLGTANISQFYMNEGSNAWQYNSEYRSTDSSRSNVEKNNALIYLVLDQSNSIGPDELPRIREAVKAFLRILYDAYN